MGGETSITHDLNSEAIVGGAGPAKRSLVVIVCMWPARCARQNVQARGVAVKRITDWH